MAFWNLDGEINYLYLEPEIEERKSFGAVSIDSDEPLRDVPVIASVQKKLSISDKSTSQPKKQIELDDLPPTQSRLKFVLLYKNKFSNSWY